MSEPTPEGETALFLSGQEMMWKGFINMHSVAKFVTKAYMVSGSFEHIKEVCFLKIFLKVFIVGCWVQVELSIHFNNC